MLRSNRRDKGEQVVAARKKLWPWVVLLLVLFCGVYAYERVTQFLFDNSDQLPFMFFDFIVEYFMGEAPRRGVTDIEDSWVHVNLNFVSL